ncbi:methylated-DNA--protein-cysteine methyltransferase-like [Hydractinia symbiolongicarpus]|uniref:methylated-DNA--protein-cysteine methyltransferase-like n=1 Tax=Hydractinia symbiolongicarpus TaxID=13093 RepID=UPI00254D7083|nr:methylated-DNA--protein-cysteine methyltransferase-like [Hydractinia symbiolongicarpus]
MSCVVQKYIITSPIGKILIESCVKGLHFVKQNEYTTDELFKPDKRIHVDLVEEESDKLNEIILSTIKWFRVYFTDPLEASRLSLPNICVASNQGSFREIVWLALAESVKAGETISYGELAKLVMKPGASRAVGSAMSNNPISIIVPCHRVIKSDGSLGNYAKGCRNNVKKWLLEYEGAISNVK